MMDNVCSVLVRPAGLQDLENLVLGNAALAWETEQRRLDYSRLRLGVLALLQDHQQKGWYFVAETSSSSAVPVVVGQLLVTFEWSDWRNGNFWWLQSVYVQPAYRRKGVFRQLYGYVMNEARARQETVCGFRLYVEKENVDAHRSYDRLGFHIAPYWMYEYEFSDHTIPSRSQDLSGRPIKGN